MSEGLATYPGFQWGHPRMSAERPSESQQTVIPNLVVKGMLWSAEVMEIIVHALKVVDPDVKVKLRIEFND